MSNLDLSYSVDNGQIVYESNASKQHFLNHYESNLTKRLVETDIVDTPCYLIIGITNKNIKEGISNISFAKEFIFF